MHQPIVQNRRILAAIHALPQQRDAFAVIGLVKK
jgi:hypothetical protein